MKSVIQGVYFLFNGGECVYVGSTSDLYRRIYEHREGRGHGMKKKFDRVEYFEVEDPEQMVNMEYFFIDVLKPKYNIDFGERRRRPQCKPSDESMDGKELKCLYDMFNVYTSSFGLPEADRICGFPSGTFATICRENPTSDAFLEDPCFLYGRRVRSDYIVKILQAKAGGKNDPDR